MPADSIDAIGWRRQYIANFGFYGNRVAKQARPQGFSAGLRGTARLPDQHDQQYGSAAGQASAWRRSWNASRSKSTT